MGTDKPLVLLKTQPALSKVSGILANTTGDWIGWGKTPYNSLPAFLSWDIVSHPESLEFYASIQKCGGELQLWMTPQEGRDVLESAEGPTHTTWLSSTHDLEELWTSGSASQRFPGLVFICVFT